MYAPTIPSNPWLKYKKSLSLEKSRLFLCKESKTFITYDERYKRGSHWSSSLGTTNQKEVTPFFDSAP